MFDKLKSFLQLAFYFLFRRRPSKSMKLAANSPSDEGLFFRYLPYIISGAVSFGASWITLKQELKADMEINAKQAQEIKELNDKWIANRERIVRLEALVESMKDQVYANHK